MNCKMLRQKYPLHRDMTSMRCVGYRQAWEYQEGEISEAELLEKGIAATRQLAKRQLTWLRSMPDKSRWIACTEPLADVCPKFGSKTASQPLNQEGATHERHQFQTRGHRHL